MPELVEAPGHYDGDGCRFPTPGHMIRVEPPRGVPTSKGGTVYAYGASDDLLELEGAIEEEWSDPQHPVWVELRGPDDTPGGPVGLLIVATFTDAGTWALGIAPLDDGVPLPSWPIRYTTTPTMPRHSAVLAIDVPAGTSYRGANE